MSADSADQRDDRVDRVECTQETLDDVGAVAVLAQPVLGATRDHLDLVLDVDAQRLAQVQQARHTVDECEHVDREVRLHRRVLVELVQHHLRVRIALELHDESYRVTGRFVAHTRMPSILRSLTSSAIFVPMTSTDV